jgi:hypothetical protein
MKMQYCSIKDTAVSAFMQPIAVAHTAQAMRSMQDAVNDPQSDFAKHPADYELYHIAEFDDQTGQFNNLEEPIRLCRVQDLITKS